MRVKHSKYKNTGLLFELLTRQVAADVLAEQNDTPALRLIKKYFASKQSILLRELKLYTTLIEARKKSYAQAHSLFSTVVDFARKLDPEALQKEKYNLIREIKHAYDEDSFFSIKVNNYKELAAVYCLFEAYTSKNTVDVKTVEQHKTTLFEHIIESTTKKRFENTRLREFADAPKDVQTLALKLMIERFNKKYGYLHSEQKNVLKEYINSVSSKNRLVEFINEEQKKIKKQLENIFVEEEILRIKINEVACSLKPVQKSQKITDSHLMTLMHCYDLIHNLRKVQK